MTDTNRMSVWFEKDLVYSMKKGAVRPDRHCRSAYRFVTIALVSLGVGWAAPGWASCVFSEVQSGRIGAVGSDLGTLSSSTFEPLTVEGQTMLPVTFRVTCTVNAALSVYTPMATSSTSVRLISSRSRLTIPAGLAGYPTQVNAFSNSPSAAPVLSSPVGIPANTPTEGTVHMVLRSALRGVPAGNYHYRVRLIAVPVGP